MNHTELVLSGLHECASDCGDGTKFLQAFYGTAMTKRLQRTYPARAKVPYPVPDEASWHIHFGYARYLCARCNCTWSGVDYGEANLRDNWCDYERCACHSAEWAVLTYEGASA